jgi:hypothetical protein
VAPLATEATEATVAGGERLVAGVKLHRLGCVCVRVRVCCDVSMSRQVGGGLAGVALLLRWLLAKINEFR